MDDRSLMRLNLVSPPWHQQNEERHRGESLRRPDVHEHPYCYGNIQGLFLGHSSQVVERTRYLNPDSFHVFPPCAPDCWWFGSVAFVLKDCLCLGPVPALNVSYNYYKCCLYLNPKPTISRLHLHPLKTFFHPLFPLQEDSFYPTCVFNGFPRPRCLYLVTNGRHWDVAGSCQFCGWRASSAM